MSDPDDGSDGEMAETAAKLDSALDSASDGSEGDAESAFDPADLIERAEAGVDALSDVLNGEERFEDVDEEVTDLIEVLEEANELLETVDLSELPGAIELRNLPAAIDADEIPEAIANAEPTRAIELRRLASLVDFTELWNAADVRAFVQNKRELEDEADDVMDDEGEDESGLLESVTPSDSSDDDSGLVDSIGSSDDGSADDESTDDGGALVDSGQAKQVAIQSKLRDAVEEFRESALDARDQLKEARDTAQEQVEEKTGGGTGQPSSRNPTAFSTMTSGWKSGDWSSATFSTVPKTVRHSSAPGHFRIYGRRFDEREEDDE